MNEWRRFFELEAGQYNDEVFVQNTDTEVTFLLDELKVAAGAKVLDLGCGTGRHAVALAGHGLRVTGIDLSDDMLAVAAATAQAAGVDVEWVAQDARAFRGTPTYDAAYCVCEGALCLLAAEDDPFERDMGILREVCKALKPGGLFVVNVLSALRHIRMFSDEDVAAGKYDPLTLVEFGEATFETPDGPETLPMRERGYTAPELRLILRQAGFEVLGIYGGTAGAWHKQVPKLDEYELMAIAQKPVTAGR